MNLISGGRRSFERALTSFKLLLLTPLALVAMSMNASATPTCVNQQVVDGFSCALDGLTFTFENVSFAGLNQSTDALFLETPPTGVSGNVADLGFQVLATYPVDIHLVYEVLSANSAIFALDNAYTPSPGLPPPQINESACANDPDANLGACVGVLANFINSSGNPEVSKSFGPVDHFWIDKDITDPGFSSFSDSVEIGVPEPASLAVIGAGLLGLTVALRRRRKAERAA